MLSKYYDATKKLESLWNGIFNIDHLTWEANKESPVIMNLQNDIGISEDLLRETYFGMANSTAEIKDNPPENLFDAKAILNRANQMPEFSSLRNSTMGDNVASVIAVGAFFTDLYNKLPTEVKSELENAKNAKEEIMNLSQYLQALQDLNSGNGENSASRINSDTKNTVIGMDEGLLDSERINAQKQLNDAKQKFDHAIESLESILSKKEAEIAYSIATSSNISKDTLNKVKDLKESLSWGDDNSGDLIRLEELDTLLELAKFLEENGFTKLVDMLGKCEKMAESLLETDLHGKDELVAYTVAPFDLEGLAPNEMLALADDPDGPMMFDLMSRIESTLHTLYEGKEPTAKGPLIFVEDVSGSTKGEVFSFLSAINFTLIKASANQNREYANIPFSGPGQYHIYRPGKNPDLKEILSHLNTGYFRGTEPYTPLLKAIEIIETDQSMKKGTILLGTDGVIGPPPQDFIDKLAQLKERRSVEIYAVLIGVNKMAVSFASKVITLRVPFSSDKDIFEILEPIL